MTDITRAQLANVYIIARRLWPYPARMAAIQHNDECHGGKPTAYIDPDPACRRRSPDYCVWCPVCEVTMLELERRGNSTEQPLDKDD